MRMVIYTVDECENENDSEGPTAYRLLHNWQLSLMVSCMIGGTATSAMKMAMTAKYTGVYLMICIPHASAIALNHQDNKEYSQSTCAASGP